MKRSNSILAALLVLAGAAAVSLPAVVQARGMAGGMAGGGRAEIAFDTLDADKDGKVTQAEITAFRSTQIAGADANGDGLLNLEELTALETKLADKMAAEHAANRLAAHDVNGDGQLSVEELLAPPLPMPLFSKIDTDGDGAVSKEEFAAAQDQMQTRGHGRGHGRKGDQMGDPQQ